MINLPSLDIEHYMNALINFFIEQYPTALSWSKSALGFLIGLSIPVSIILLIGIIYSVERLKIIRKKEGEIYDKPKELKMASSTVEKNNKEMSERWSRVILHIESPNDNDWRQAIIEADIILSDLLVKLGYRGSSIGEQLKRANRGDFKTLDDAWDAHKIRNEIAHGGTEFKINQLEARRVIGLYRKVFEEFFHI